MSSPMESLWLRWFSCIGLTRISRCEKSWNWFHKDASRGGGNRVWLNVLWILRPWNFCLVWGFFPFKFFPVSYQQFKASSIWDRAVHFLQLKQITFPFIPFSFLLYGSWYSLFSPTYFYRGKCSTQRYRRSFLLYNRWTLVRIRARVRKASRMRKANLCRSLSAIFMSGNLVFSNGLSWKLYCPRRFFCFWTESAKFRAMIVSWFRNSLELLLFTQFRLYSASQSTSLSFTISYLVFIFLFPLSLTFSPLLSVIPGWIYPFASFCFPYHFIQKKNLQRRPFLHYLLCRASVSYCRACS